MHKRKHGRDMNLLFLGTSAGVPTKSRKAEKQKSRKAEKQKRRRGRFAREQGQGLVPDRLW